MHYSLRTLLILSAIAGRGVSANTWIGVNGMASWKRALSLGLLVWLVPFIVALIISSLKGSWRSLFESIMPVTLAVVVVAFALLYFARTSRASLREGSCLGMLWLAVSVLIDLPLMLNPPISMQPSEYVADIGITYLMIPVITVGVAVSAVTLGNRPT